MSTFIILTITSYLIIFNIIYFSQKRKIKIYQEQIQKTKECLELIEKNIEKLQNNTVLMKKLTLEYIEKYNVKTNNDYHSNNDNNLEKKS